MFTRISGAVAAATSGAGTVGLLRRELEKTKAAAARCKARIERQARRITELTSEHRSLRLKLRHVRAQMDARRHSSLTPKVLEQLLAVRVRSRPVLSSDSAAAEARERHLLDTSSAYRDVALDDGGRADHLERVEIGGIAWWVPRAGGVARLREHGFPLKAILQTREVAIGGVMLDLGANIGRTSITRLLLGDVRAVYAAEPEPGNYACLVQNVLEHRLRGYVLPDQVAIGAARGEVQLRRSQYVGGHRVLYGNAKSGAETVRIALWPLDEWMDRLAIEAASVSFVKVDTQGSEVGVLRGATSLLRRPHVAWQIEVDPMLLRAAGTDVVELLTILETHFTHFIDLGAGGVGARVRRIHDVREALGYVGQSQNKTDLVVYHARA